MLLDNVRRNFEAVTAHGDGSFSYTNDLICRNAFSDVAVIMSYSLLEGFFGEEYDFYVKNKRPKHLINIITAVIDFHKIEIKDWGNRKKKIDTLRLLRNAAAHNNGTLRQQIDINSYNEVFNDNSFNIERRSVRFSLEGAITLIREIQEIADEYAEAVFMSL